MPDADAQMTLDEFEIWWLRQRELSGLDYQPLQAAFARSRLRGTAGTLYRATFSTWIGLVHKAYTR